MPAELGAVGLIEWGARGEEKHTGAETTDRDGFLSLTIHQSTAFVCQSHAQGGKPAANPLHHRERHTLSLVHPDLRFGSSPALRLELLAAGQLRSVVGKVSSVAYDAASTILSMSSTSAMP